MHRQGTFAIAGRALGPEHPPYVIAAMSANHLGRRERALAILEAAAAAGSDAVTLQTYTADAMTLPSAGPGFSIDRSPGRTLYDLYAEAQTPWAWHAELFERARALRLAILGSVADPAGLARLRSLDAPAYRIASCELGDHELVAACAATGRPLLLSTGMAGLDEIEEALAVARAAGDGGLALLHCVSGHPTPVAEANLRRLGMLARHFGVLLGSSDHSAGSAVAVAAVALGARIVEKHVTLARADGGPDAEFALEPHELAAVVSGCRTAFHALGTGAPGLAPSERANVSLRRSLYVVEDVPAGAPLTRANVRAIRPGYGLPPRELPRVLGRRTRVSLARGTPLRFDHLAGEQPVASNQPSPALRSAARLPSHRRVRAAAVIQARLGSARLTDRELLPLAGAPVLSHLIERARRIPGVDVVCVAAPAGDAHQRIADLVRKHEGVLLVRGPEDDVLRRFLLALDATDADLVLRIRADRPLLDPAIAGAVLALLRSARTCLAATAPESGYPLGYDVEAIEARALRSADAEARGSDERERVTPFLWRRPERFPAVTLDRAPSLRHWRLALDTPDDYGRIAALFEALHPRDPAFGFEAVREHLERHPELLGSER